jgi:DNA end-binding protein Ku
MRAVWKGSITFGLVNIPVALQNASRTEELKFKLLRRSDLSPVNYKRVAQVDGREVPWNEIVKGYEYEKGKYVVLKEEDFQRVDLEATDTIDIVDFVEVEEINPMFFYKPYFLEPVKGGAGAYSLLRQVLYETKKVGISKVIIKKRQHLAAVKANKDLLILELMRFEDELISHSAIKTSDHKKPSAREVSMAKTLVEQMTEEWNPARYTDDYRSALMKLIDKKVSSGGKELPAKGNLSKRPTNVIDLADVLRQSLADASKGKSAVKGKAKSKAAKASRARAA